MSKVLSAQDIQAILDEFATGATQISLALKYGVSTGRMRNIIKNANRIRAPEGEPKLPEAHAENSENETIEMNVEESATQEAKIEYLKDAAMYAASLAVEKLRRAAQKDLNKLGMADLERAVRSIKHAAELVQGRPMVAISNTLKVGQVAEGGTIIDQSGFVVTPERAISVQEWVARVGADREASSPQPTEPSLADGAVQIEMFQAEDDNSTA